MAQLKLDRRESLYRDLSIASGAFFTGVVGAEIARIIQVDRSLVCLAPSLILFIVSIGKYRRAKENNHFPPRV